MCLITHSYGSHCCSVALAIVVHRSLCRDHGPVPGIATGNTDCSVGSAYDAQYTENGFKGHAISAHLGEDQPGNKLYFLPNGDTTTYDGVVPEGADPVMRPQCCHQASESDFRTQNESYADRHTKKCQCYDFPKFRKAKLTWGNDNDVAYVFLSA